jgi:hypothetical protein
MNLVSNTEIAHHSWNRLFKISAVAALMAGVLFLIAIINLVVTGLQSGAVNEWLALFPDNWLAVIFKLHAGFKGVESGRLFELNFLDIAIMALIATMYIGLYAALRKTSKIWSIIASVQPFLGIALLIATKSAGRSGVMGGGLVISFVMLRSKIFNKITAFMGIISSIFLLVGDISVGVSHSDVIAILTGTGYLVLTAWFFLIAQRLFQLEGDVS